MKSAKSISVWSTSVALRSNTCEVSSANVIEKGTATGLSFSAVTNKLTVAFMSDATPSPSLTM